MAIEQIGSADGWLVLSDCVNCHSKTEAYRTEDTAPVLFINFCGGSLPVITRSMFVKCSGCGLVMQSPRMTDERILEYYSSGLYRDTLGIPVDVMDADELRRAREVAKWLKDGGINPVSHADIGASRGYLLAEAGAGVQKGYDVNPNYGDYGIIQNEKYELVSSIHVLEHVINPLSEIRLYQSLSCDKVLIEVPGENCKGGPLRFAHLYYYHPTVLANMIQDAGMSIVSIETEPNTRILAKV